MSVGSNTGGKVWFTLSGHKARANADELTRLTAYVKIIK